MNEYKDLCVFCDIAPGLVKADVLLEGHHHMILTPLNPVTPGHILVIPKTHVEDFADDPSETSRLMLRAAQFVKASNFGQCNLVTSRGLEATQSVFHLHLHLIPRKYGDGLKLPWTGQEKTQ